MKKEGENSGRAGGASLSVCEREREKVRRERRERERRLNVEGVDHND